MDYPALIAEVTERTGYADVATRAQMYTEAAEARLNKLLRLDEAKVNLTTDTTGAVSLPEDFARAVLITHQGREIAARDLASILASTATGYAIEGTKLRTSWASAPLVMRYKTRLPPLALYAGNWLLDEEPEIYLYALMYQVFAAKSNVEKASVAEAVLMERIAAKRNDDFVKNHARQDYTIPGAEYLF